MKFRIIINIKIAKIDGTFRFIVGFDLRANLRGNWTRYWRHFDSRNSRNKPERFIDFGDVCS